METTDKKTNSKDETGITDKKTNSKKERLLITVLASLFTPFTVFVAIPLLIFLNNTSQFYFDWYDFLPYCLLFALLGAGILFSIVFFLPQKAYKICLHILIALDILVFLQSTYLNGSISLIGDNMGYSVSTAKKIFNFFIWAIFIAGFIVLAILKDKKKYIKTVSLVLVVIISFAQTVSTIIPIASDKKFFKSAESRYGYSPESLTNANFKQYSTSSNIYYFLVDRFDEIIYAEEAYKEKPELFDNLKGFTWFQDNIAMYGHTFPAVAYMLTGNEFDCANQYRVDYLTKAYQGDTYLKELSDFGYKIKLYTEDYYAYELSNVPEIASNKKEGKIRIKSKFKLSSKMAMVGTFLSVPHALKSLFSFISTPAIKNCVEISTDSFKQYSSENSTVNEYVNSTDFEKSKDKQFSFIHLSGLHALDDGRHKPLPLIEECINIIYKFIDNLKENGLYDSSTIIITGDHSATYNDRTGVNQPRLTALFFKPSQSHEDAEKPLIISNAKVSQKILCRQFSNLSE